MKCRTALAAAAAFLSLTGAALAADVYTIDTAHSSVGFAISHLGINVVRGTFADVSGAIVYDELDITRSKVTATIAAAGITTNNARRDTHLRSQAFFDVERFPDITFESLRVEPQRHQLVCIGTLTMRGVSKEIVIPFKITGKAQDTRGQARLGIAAELTLDRQEYGISWNKAVEGGMMIGNRVRVTLDIEAVRQPPTPPLAGGS